ncbi:MAG: DinB family protein [Gemmatimonadota bacterium]|nr:MAG: DinB family protein [Gemmatimonadota bacterium]
MDFRLDHTIEILERTPGTLRSLLSDLSKPWVTCNEGTDTWTAFDVVGHLIHGEEADWIGRLQSILEHGEWRTFTPFDRFAQFEKTKGKSLAELLDSLAALREESLAKLKELDLQPEHLERRGTHPEFGSVTAKQLLATWAVHDLGHIAQIVRVMAKRYSDDVGPWSAYLRILRD